MKIIGIVGTAKNTGKTTSLSYLLSEAYQNKINFGVTGIGYDGEEIDNITFLPKPRLFFNAGTIITTSKNCLESADIKFETLVETEFKTALGEIVIVRTLSPGMVVIAGPNKKSTLNEVISRMKKFGAEIIFVDGSLNRLAPMSIADKLIFTTGASRNTNIDFLVEEMKIVQKIFSFRTSSASIRSKVISLISESGVTELSTGSLLDADDINELAQKMYKSVDKILIPNLVSQKTLIELVTNLFAGRKNSLELILDSPLSLLLFGEPVSIQNIVDLIESHPLTISYLRKPELIAVTVNPFYPKPIDHSFKSEYIDKDLLMKKMSSGLNVSVYNLKDSHNIKLFEECISG